ncbi:CCA tRNA nucleotidyltransferase [Salinithrix halophila]|uniref:CCA tRNA nucleotidyltransferase n=1 Tax=Salinithrix halophila TaxID=1485204 RepID=A0ABV8JMR2_9BACL
MNPALKDALTVLEHLEKAGYQAYLVGGCVRDRLMGREPADWDVATDACPDTVQALFPWTVPTGLRHGTVSVLHKKGMTEVTTFRREGAYTDHRRPDAVVFMTDLSKDLARRDFTINAMAEDRRGRLYDPFKGQQDLKQKQIRAVGEPDHRFTEDALRMVRALRFAAQLEFSIEEKTEAAIQRSKCHLTSLAVERVTGELKKLFRAPRPSLGVRYLWKHNLFPVLPPFSRWEMAVPNSPNFPAETLDSLDGEATRWAFFLLMCGVEVSVVRSRLKSFRVSQKEWTEIAVIFQLALSRKEEWQEMEAKRAILEHGWEAIYRGTLLAGEIHGWPPQVRDHCLKALAGWHQEMPVRNQRDLAVNGQDLIRISGRPPGSWVGKVLEELLVRTALGQLPNDKTALMKEGRRIGKFYP